MGFLLFPVGEEWFSRFMRIPLGIFWRCKIDEILTVILHLVLRMILIIWFSSKVRNLLRKCLRSTASPLFQKYETYVQSIGFTFREKGRKERERERERERESRAKLTAKEISIQVQTKRVSVYHTIVDVTGAFIYVYTGSFVCNQFKTKVATAFESSDFISTCFFVSHRAQTFALINIRTVCPF